MRLSNKELKVLGALDLRANLSVREVAKQTGLREHSVRYAIQSLTKRKLIQRNTLINIYALGYVNYGLLFSVHTRKKGVRNSILSFLLASPSVSFLCELGGDYQYEITVVAKHLREFVSFQEALVEKFGNIFTHKSTAIRQRLFDFQSKYLYKTESPHRWLSWGLTDEQFEVDMLDNKILSALASYQAHSAAELARLLKVPDATVEFRLRRLEKRKIIGGYLNLLNTRSIGIHSHILLLFMRGLSPAIRKKVFNACLQQPNCRFLIENIGEWDFEVGLEAIDPEDINLCTQDLYEVLGDDIFSMKIVPIFRYHKVVNYPLS